MKDTLICLGAGKSQVPVIMAAKSLGYSVIAIDMDAKAPGFIHADDYLIHSSHDFVAIIKSLEIFDNQLVKAFKWVGILNRSSGPPVVTAAKICEHFNLPGVSVSDAETILHKDLLREACSKFSIPSPTYQLLNKNQLPVLPLATYPVVVKPALSMVGKSGVSVVRNERELLEAIKYASSFTINERLVVEEYLAGSDHSFIGFVDNGNVHKICFLDEINAENEAGKVFGKGFKTHTRSPEHDVELEADIISQKIVSNFNIIRSPFMASYRSDLEGNLYLIEIHLDLGGDLLIENLFPSALNINFTELAVKMAVGNMKLPAAIEVKPSAVIFDEGLGLVSDRKCRVVTSDTQEELEMVLNGR